MSDYSFIGKGSLYFQNGSGPLYSVGNATQANITLQTETYDEDDYQNLGGGIADNYTRIKSAQMDIIIRNLNAANVALALFGAAPTANPVVAVTAETHTAGLGSLILFDHIPDPSVTYSVKKIVPAVGEGEPTVTTYTEGTDYELKKSGIYLPASGSAILAEDTLTVAYTSLADHAIEAMTEVPAQVRVYIDGFNEAKSGRPVNVDIFNCKFSPAKSLDMISKDWAVIEVSATALRDDTKTGAGISKYMKLRFADVVAA